MPDGEDYNPADKFGTPEDAPQTYLLEDGREVSKEEFLEQVRHDAAARGGGEPKRSETRVINPFRENQ